MTYDPAGNLATVALPATGSSSAETVSYSSNGDGLRQTRTVGTTTTDLLWDTNAATPLLLDDGTYSYIYGPSTAPIAEINDTTGSIHYLTADLIGSTRLITSSTGTVDSVTLYDEYGNVEQQTGTVTSPIGYSGNWTDPDTGLVYLRARDYDPHTAQFLTIDPLVDTTRQPYTYVADNPLTQTDPSGCDPWDDIQNSIAVALMHGPGADLASLLEGIGDGASFGLTGEVRQAMGTNCEVQKNGFYFAGMIAGGIAASIVTAGFGGVGDAADAGEAAEEGASEAADIGEDATESVSEDAGEDTADDSAETCTVGGQSFSANTPVVLADGTTEPIADVRVGQKVKAVDTRTGKDVIRTVTTLWVKHDTDLMDVTVTNSAGVSSTIHTTAHHLFWDLTTHEWVDADKLGAGDRLRSDNGTTVTFTRSALVPGTEDMWDLTVNGAHDFYISTPTTTTLVHNNDCDTPAGNALRNALTKQAGFSGTGPKIIVDENLPSSLASGLRDAGYDARSVEEMGLAGTKDPQLNLLAQQVGAKVLTRDVGHDLAGGFFQNGITLDARLTSLSSILRILGGSQNGCGSSTWTLDCATQSRRNRCHAGYGFSASMRRMPVLDTSCRAMGVRLGGLRERGITTRPARNF